MDLKKLLLELRSKEVRNQLVHKLKEQPEATSQIIPIAFGIEQPEAWRATWVLKEIVKKDHSILTSHIDRLLQVIPNRPDGHQRELLQLLENADLNDDQEGQLFDLAIGIWSSISQGSATRYRAFERICEIITRYPELVNEINHLTTSEFLEPLSPGIRKGALKLIAKLPKS